MKKPAQSTRLKKIAKCIISDLSDPFYQNVAPGLAYYFLLSIAPIIISLSYFAGILFVGSNLLTNAINKYLPEELADILIPFFSHQSATAGLVATIFFFIFTLYLASRGFYALIKVADYASDNLEVSTFKEVPLVMAKRHIKAIILTLMMLVIIVFSLLFMVFGRATIDIWAAHMDSIQLTGYLYAFSHILSYPVALSVIFLILLIFYAWMPSKRLKYREVVPGAAAASIGIILASFGFVIYIKYFFSNNAIYGALSSIILLILWFFLLSHVLVFGIMLNQAFKDTRSD